MKKEIPPRLQIAAPVRGKGIAQYRQAEGVLGPPPGGALEGQAGGEGTVHLGKGQRLALAVRFHRPQENPQVVVDGLFHVHPEAVLDLVAVAHLKQRLRVGAGMGVQVVQGILEAGQPRLVAPGQNAHLAGLPAQCVGVFDFHLVAVMPADGVVGRLHVGFLGAGHAAEAQHPLSLVPLAGEAPAEAPGVRRVVVGGVGHVAPVHELAAGVLGVGVVVEHVEGGEIAHGEDEAVLVHRSRQLVEIGVDFFRAATQVPGLTQEKPLPIDLGIGAGGAGDFAVGEASQTGQAGKGDSLGDFGVEIELPSSPGAEADMGCGGEGVAQLPVVRQAVLAGIGRGERRLPLPDVGTLDLDVPILPLRRFGAGGEGKGHSGEGQGEEEGGVQAWAAAGRGVHVFLGVSGEGKTARMVANRGGAVK
jgi:hypothetical protein